MTKNKTKVFLFIDDNVAPIAELETPTVFDFDTSKLADGAHQLKIVSQSVSGKEGMKLISFTVKNGPNISIEGLKNNEVVDGTLPLMINTYDQGNHKNFLIEGSETPQTIPVWIWIMMIVILGWGAYYVISYINP